MYNFSIWINDNMAPDFSGKIAAGDRFKINNLETESTIEDTDIADLDGGHLAEIRSLLISHFKKLVLLSAAKPVTEFEYYRRLFRKAHVLGVEYIKVPAGEATAPLGEKPPAAPEGDTLPGDNPAAAGKVPAKEGEAESQAESFREICRIGKAYGIGVLVENNSKTALPSASSVARFFESAGKGSAELIFNPLEYVRIKRHPFLNEFYNSRLKNMIRFLRVSDGLFVDGEAVLPAQGNGEIKEMASILLARGFKGYFSFTPYLKDMSLRDYEEIIERFKKLLTQM